MQHRLAILTNGQHFDTPDQGVNRNDEGWKHCNAAEQLLTATKTGDKVTLHTAYRMSYYNWFITMLNIYKCKYKYKYINTIIQMSTYISSSICLFVHINGRDKLDPSPAPHMTLQMNLWIFSPQVIATDAWLMDQCIAQTKKRSIAIQQAHRK